MDPIWSYGYCFTKKSDRYDWRLGCRPGFYTNRFVSPGRNSKQPVVLWLFQLDDSKSLHKKWLFHQTSIKKWLFRLPGLTFQVSLCAFIGFFRTSGMTGWLTPDRTTPRPEAKTLTQFGGGLEGCFLGSFWLKTSKLNEFSPAKAVIGRRFCSYWESDFLGNMVKLWVISASGNVGR